MSRSPTTTLDAKVHNHGTIFMVEPLTPSAENWIQQNIGDDAQFLGRLLAVEHRFIGDIVDGMMSAGLRVA